MDTIEKEHVHKPEAVSDAAVAEPVFYMTAMDKLASKHQTRLWLSSIRNVGKWKGEIVIVTDKPDCLAKNLGENLLGAKLPAETKAMDVYSGGKDGGKIYMVQQPVTTNVREMKAQKAKAWLHVRAAGLKPPFLIHTDQDIVFGEDVNRFVTMVKNEIAPNPPMLALFDDQGTTKGELHTGIVVMFPSQATDQCLADWGEKTLHTKSKKYKGFSTEEGEAASTEEGESDFLGPDQRALKGTPSCRAKSGGIRKMAKEFLMMPTKKRLGKGSKATFIHFTNTKRWKEIKNDLMQKYFTQVLGLPDMEFFGYETCSASFLEATPSQ